MWQDFKALFKDYWPYAIVVAAVLFLLATCAGAKAQPSAEWDIDSYINGTNVVVGAEGRGFCSGTIISAKYRLILTAAHCVKDRVVREEVEKVDPVTGEVSKKTIERKLDLEVWQSVTKDYEIISTMSYRAKAKGVDKKADVAILQVVDENYKPRMEAKLADGTKPLKRGMTVFVIGNPGVTLDNSITKGILSAPERQLDFEDGDGPVKLFQIDAAVIGGNSGGQVVNEEGEIIGTVTGGLRGTTINFAAPIAQTKALLIASGFPEVADRKVPAALRRSH